MSDRAAVPLTITCEGLTKRYGTGRNQHVAVMPLTADFTSSSSVGIVGESGSGKSTLARMLVSLETPSEGTVRIDGRDAGELLQSKAGRLAYRRAVQFIGQDTTSSFDPRHPLMESVVRPLMILCGVGREEAMSRAGETLDSLGLSRRMAERYPSDVSGGQRQRFAIARSLAVRPRVLICDEVVSALDVSIQGMILNELKEYCERAGAGLIFVSHGLPATAFVADELMVMYRGEVIERGRTDDVVENPQAEYTRLLLDAHRGGAAGVSEDGEA